MAPSKFEKHIKEQLEEREIPPSAQAWERLSESLDTVVPPVNKRNYYRYAIAASFIGILIVSLVYFNSGSPETNPDVQLVETNKEAPETMIVPDGKVETDSEQTVVQNDKITPQPAIRSKTVNQIEIPDVRNKVASGKETDVVSDATIEKTVMPKDVNEELLNTKILEIVATVDSLEMHNTALTNAEVDMLLRNAQAEILRDKLFNENGSVDAMALLTEVEDELDQSFRDQLFDSLKEGFLKVRTAVADRNK